MAGRRGSLAAGGESVGRQAASLRLRLQNLPELNPVRLWPAQIEAVRSLEKSLGQNRPRSLIQMATGSGKTFTAVTSIYRLIKEGGARRVLFLVDRGNLGKQAMKEFEQYVTPDDGRKFTDLYIVQRLTSSRLDHEAKVCICTIQFVGARNAAAFDVSCFRVQ
jgi:type I restriction enzyme R subunit